MLTARTGKLIVALACLVVFLACAAPAQADGLYIQYEGAYVSPHTYGRTEYIDEHGWGYSFFVPDPMGGAGFGILIGVQGDGMSLGARLSLSTHAATIPGETSWFTTDCRQGALSAVLEFGMYDDEDICPYFLLEPSFQWLKVNDGAYSYYDHLYADETFTGFTLAVGGGLRCRVAGGLSLVATTAYRFGQYNYVANEWLDGSLSPQGPWTGGWEFRMGARYTY